MKKPQLEGYLADLEENLQRAVEFVRDYRFEDFEKDRRTQYAVIRALEPAVPWKAMAGMVTDSSMGMTP